MKKIMFITGGETIARMFVNIIKEIKDADYEVLVIDRDYYSGMKSREVFKQNNISSKGLESYHPDKVNHILELEKPNIIAVGHDSTPIERAFISTSRELRIPSLLVQDGVIPPSQKLSTVESIKKFTRTLPYILKYPRWIFRPYLFNLSNCGITNFSNLMMDWVRNTHAYGKGKTDKIAAMSPLSKKVFAKLGFDPKDIIVTGQPRFDGLFYPKFTKPDVYKQLDLDLNNKIVLLAPPIFTADEKQSAKRRKMFVQSVVNSLDSREELALVIKVHPGLGERIEIYEEILGESQCVVTRVVKEFDVPSLITASTIFISELSTMALEALILERPTIIFNLFNEIKDHPLLTSKAFLVARNTKELHNIINSLLYDETFKAKQKLNQDHFIYEYAYKNDGKASKRVSELIKQICEEQQLKG